VIETFRIRIPMDSGIGLNFTQGRKTALRETELL
jgi:hypothetical protein